MTDETTPNNDQPVTISAPPVPTVTIDPQNPLPEPSFFWRRWIAIIISAFALVLAWFTAGWLNDGQQWKELYGLTKLVIYFAGLILTYYFIAPSATELTNMIQSAKIIKSSLAMAADATSDKSKATENALDRAESGAERRFQRSAAADSRIPPEAPVAAPTADSDEIDAAPRSKLND